MSGALAIWTIYCKPRDCPDAFIARKFLVAGPVPTATHEVLIAAAIEPLREWFERQGLVCIQRSPGDDPVTVESWL